jgi:hypothetical protein
VFEQGEAEFDKNLVMGVMVRDVEREERLTERARERARRDR